MINGMRCSPLVLEGSGNVLRPLVPAMCMARRGRIVTLASATGQMGNAGQVNYGAAKEALSLRQRAWRKKSHGEK